VLALRASSRSMTRSLLAGTASGIAFALASALTQPLTGQVTQGGVRALTSPLTVAMAAMVISGLLLSQLAYRDSGLGAPLATVTLTNPVASAAIAVAVLGERTAGGLWGALAVFGGAALAAWGVVLLAEPADRPARYGRAGRTRAVDDARTEVFALGYPGAFRGAGRPPDRSVGPSVRPPGGDGRARSARLSVGRRIVPPVRRRCGTTWRRSWGRRRRHVG
jgi:hypothetical protein